MITPGIQENVRLTSVEKNDKGTLVIKLQQGDAVTTTDFATAFGSNQPDEEQGIFLWPFKADDRLTTPDAIAAALQKSITELRDKLFHILEQYQPTKDVVFGIFRNLPTMTSSEAFVKALMTPGEREIILAGIYNNMTDDFVNLMKPHTGPASPLMRWKLVRQGKDRHFPTLPKFTPFVEPMTIKPELSKLKFSPYDLGYRKGDPEGQPSGLNLADGTPAAGENSKVDSKEKAVTDQLFNKLK